jgi:NAD(P)-dependent dehydrogenase (short-subunit alcohol dehydrogenase family)
MARFDSKVVIVTGGGSGIGADVARRFAAEGARVAVADLNMEGAQAVVDEIKEAGGRAVPFRTDVAEEKDIRNLVEGTVEAFGSLDVVVNNAGVGEESKALEDRSLEDWSKVIDVNLTGVFLGTKHGAQAMKALEKPGVIINVASILGHVGFQGAPAYSAAKHGVLGFTKAVSLELAEFGIRCVAVCPAFIQTPLIEGMEEHVLPLHPMGRLGEPKEVSDMILFLASDEASFLTGASYLVDGGYTSQ